MAPPASEVRFPFSAIVAQERMKRALLLNAVNPGVGGVLIRGNKGTAKSTAVRALASVLPTIDVVAGCPLSCAPGPEREACTHCSTPTTTLVEVTRPVRIVDLPVGASEDRLIGSLDVERALSAGEQVFEPGILAAAHRGILYIDEANLLNDHLVDLLLDAAAMGQNYVERDGLSVSHPARFILVGTMNPEEGELRPQLLDRFGLMVEADHDFTTEERVEVVKRRIGFEANPAGFMGTWSQQEEGLRSRIVEARSYLPSVRVSDEMFEAIAHVCRAHAVDGLRADIVIHRTASTIAAWDGRTDVTLEDVREASGLALAHRQRRRPFEEPRLDPEQLSEALDDFERTRRPRHPDSGSLDDLGSSDGGRTDHRDDSDAEDDPAGAHDPGDGRRTGDLAEDAGTPTDRQGIGAPLAMTPPAVKRPDQRVRGASGRRATTVSEDATGHHAGSRLMEGPARDLDVSATLRVAASHQATRGSEQGIQIRRSDLQTKVREAKAPTLVVFVVDASGSMGARQRMEATKGAILSLLVDAYQKRDRVALITARGAGAEVVLPPTRSIEIAHRHLQEIATGGRTPLWAGLECAAELIDAERRREPGVIPLLVLLSDGRSNVPRGGTSSADAAQAAGIRLREMRVPGLVVDTESGYVRLGHARTLATLMGADYAAFDALEDRRLADSVRERLAEVSPSRPPI